MEIQKKVNFLGLISNDHVHAEMKSADAFVLSSHYETFGVVLIEALACGKPIIATSCGGPECIVNKKNGLLITPRDIEKLVLAMKTIEKNIMLKRYKMIVMRGLAKRL